MALPARVQTGFNPRKLLAALDVLAAGAPHPPAGLVLGSGFECNPRLVARLAERFRLLGTGAAAIHHAKDPTTFFALLDRLAVAHPETRTTPPEAPDGWLMKRIGGSGGLHIVPCPAHPRHDPRRYFQRHVAGQAVSLAAIADGNGLEVVGVSAQWPSPLARRPYRYGGAVTSTDGDPKLQAKLAAIAEPIARELALTGLLSFDFVVDGELTWLIEVNPRPGATLDIFDTDDGWLFAAHVAAATQSPLPQRACLPAPRARASAIVYADRGPLTIRETRWPEWIADRPMPGSIVGAHQPLTSVTADADTSAAAEQLCRERVVQAMNMLYGPGPGKETQQ